MNATTRSELPFRESPADSELFGIRFWELNLDQTTPNQARDMLPQWTAKLAAESPALVTARVDCRSTEWLMALAENGFYLVDTQVGLRLLARNFTPMNQQVPFPARLGEVPAERIEELADLAARIFKIDRLHADPHLPPAKVDERYRTWVRRARTDGSLLLAHERTDTGKWISFIQLRAGSGAGQGNILLGGLDSEYHGSRIGASLIGVYLEEFMRRGFEDLTTAVSLANLGLIRTYQRFGFVPITATHAFHRYLPGPAAAVTG